MFCNGLEMDGGDTAYLGPTTIIEMTIPMSQSSSDATLDDSWVLQVLHIQNPTTFCLPLQYMLSPKSLIHS